MKISKQQIKMIIREERQKLLLEQDFGSNQERQTLVDLALDEELPSRLSKGLYDAMGGILSHYQNTIGSGDKAHDLAMEEIERIVFDFMETQGNVGYGYRRAVDRPDAMDNQR